MNKICFPGFNFNFNISPIAIKIWNLEIYWYAIFIVSAIILSMFLLYFSKKKYNIEYDDIIEVMLVTLIFGIIGARLFYIIFNLEYYYKNLNEILNIKNGGLAIFGGIISGSLISFIMCKKKKMDYLDFCDSITPYLILSQCIGRLGNFFNVEAYGIETSNIFRMGINTFDGYIEVHPCFLYEMIACFIIFIFLKYKQKNQKFKGEILSFYCIFYGIARLIIEGIRADSLMLFNVKISQIMSVILIIIGIIINIRNNKKKS